MTLLTSVACNLVQQDRIALFFYPNFFQTLTAIDF